MKFNLTADDCAAFTRQIGDEMLTGGRKLLALGGDLLGKGQEKLRECGKVYVGSGKELCGKLRELPAAVRAEIEDDIAAVKSRDPAAKSGVEILLLYSGVHALLAYRVSHKLYVGKHYFSARLISQLSRFCTGIEIHPGAKIGKGFFIDHGAGVVIGETAEIGDNCTLYQGVTLGGTGKDTGKRHPTLGDGVMVGAGAKVLGPLKIGSDSKVAAGAVVLEDIPENSTAVGIPARVVRRDGQRIDDLDQVHIPDPVAQELSRLEEKIDTLEKELAAYKEQDKDKDKDKEKEKKKGIFGL